MTQWLYLASAARASLASTLAAIENHHFLWRSLLKSSGELNSNVGEIQAGDLVLVAWRHDGKRRTAYLRAIVADPLAPRRGRVAIEALAGEAARELVAAGYPASEDGTVEGLRLAEVDECCFELQGSYGGNNAIHRLAAIDAAGAQRGDPVPPKAYRDVARRRRRAARTPARTPARSAAPVVAGPGAYGGLDGFSVRGAVEPAARAFDAYAMVDWSSSSGRCHGDDSIWIASGAWDGATFAAATPRNPSTRHEAAAELRGQLERWRGEGRRVLVGLDFAFGYPTGFAHRLGLQCSGPAWKTVHAHFAARVTDDAGNVHNRDAFADECNRRIGAPGPFWGCVAGAETPALTRQRVGIFTFPHHGLREWRLTDDVVRRRVTTQSVWKLNCGVSVGGQTILGIKHLEELASSVSGRRWPFEGWGAPEGPEAWFAEIFPSLVIYDEWRDEYARRRDRTQVMSCLRRAAERDAAGLLRGDLAPPAGLDASALAQVQDEEGWILWADPS
jgi:hypothetical protein